MAGYSLFLSSAGPPSSILMRGWAANEVLWINTHIQIHANPLKQFYKQSFSRSNPNGAAHRLTRRRSLKSILSFGDIAFSLKLRKHERKIGKRRD